ncbi:MAG TPA: hypothetical protein VFF21_01015 [Flavobacteriaceae bacterium]|nr:hypothetical protein [Flavobacteriaceae bacterium]
MKNFVAILLSTLILTQGAGLGVGDILLFGRLLEHAQCHSENYGDDFLTFLAEHYGPLYSEHKDAHGEDDSHHKHLPFHHDQCHHSIAEVIVYSYEFPIERAYLPIISDSNFFYLDLHSSFEKTPLFQPPKIA